jgi:hypothetical protein
MRKGIEIEVTAGDRARLEAIVADRNSPQKHVWRARIILATAEGCGTAAVMRRAGVSKPCVWRWQERFMTAGVDGLLRDRTRPLRIPPMPKAVVETVVARTLDEAPPDGASHWTAPAMAAASGHQPVRRGPQPRPQAVRLESRYQCHHRRRQKGISSVRFDPLSSFPILVAIMSNVFLSDRSAIPYGIGCPIEAAPLAHQSSVNILDLVSSLIELYLNYHQYTSVT